MRSVALTHISHRDVGQMADDNECHGTGANFDRRHAILAAGLGLGSVPLTAVVARAAQHDAPGGDAAPRGPSLNAAELGLVADSNADQSHVLQAAIDTAALRRMPLQLPPGRFRAAGLVLRPDSAILGASGLSVLALSNAGPLIAAENARGLILQGLSLDGGLISNREGYDALVSLKDCPATSLTDIAIVHAFAHAIAVERCSGRIEHCRIEHAGDAAIFSLDAAGLQIADNDIRNCGNNGIQVWRSDAGEDATIVSRNRIAHVEARGGGTGQNGNGINVFRAGNVIVDGNRVSDCAYSAVRGNAASNIQVMSNNCQRLGEVAIYAEFGFEGAVIAGNVVDGAAAGISVTNFDVGGRLAVVQGNLVRNLKRREHEPVDKRGEGISVEADAVVSGNTIENAPTAGLVLGWGRYLRNIAATGNVVRNARIGILISADPAAGACLVTGNLISGASQGAIRGMDAEGRAVGTDLARTTTETGRILINGNLAV